MVTVYLIHAKHGHRLGATQGDHAVAKRGVIVARVWYGMDRRLPRQDLAALCPICSQSSISASLVSFEHGALPAQQSSAENEPARRSGRLKGD